MDYSGVGTVKGIWVLGLKPYFSICNTTTSSRRLNFHLSRPLEPIPPPSLRGKNTPLHHKLAPRRRLPAWPRVPALRAQHHTPSSLGTPTIRSPRLRTAHRTTTGTTYTLQSGNNRRYPETPRPGSPTYNPRPPSQLPPGGPVMPPETPDPLGLDDQGPCPLLDTAAQARHPRLTKISGVH